MTHWVIPVIPIITIVITVPSWGAFCILSQLQGWHLSRCIETRTRSTTSGCRHEGGSGLSSGGPIFLVLLGVPRTGDPVLTLSRPGGTPPAAPRAWGRCKCGQVWRGLPHPQGGGEADPHNDCSPGPPSRLCLQVPLLEDRDQGLPADLVLPLRPQQTGQVALPDRMENVQGNVSFRQTRSDFSLLLV